MVDKHGLNPSVDNPAVEVTVDIDRQVVANVLFGWMEATKQ